VHGLLFVLTGVSRAFRESGSFLRGFTRKAFFFKGWFEGGFMGLQGDFSLLGPSIGLGGFKGVFKWGF